MRHPVWMALALASALALAGCGGGSSPSAPTLSTVASVNAASTAPTTAPTSGFKQIVAFGDSLSDGGTYTPLAVATYYHQLQPNAQSANGVLQQFGNALVTDPTTALQTYGAVGGQFTVNPGPGWIADLATSLNTTPTPLPNQIGYGYVQDPTTGVFSTQAIFPTMNCVSTYGKTTPSLCTNFAQGGSRVSQQPGIGYYTINPTTGLPYTDSSGVPYVSALTVPVSTQVSTYLSEFGGAFNANQLITMLAGNNDVFMALSTASTDIAGGMSQSTAVAQAQATVAQAADDLATQVKTILSDGGKYVLVYTLPDSSNTPFGRALPFTVGKAYDATAAAAGDYSNTGPPPGYVCNNQDPSTPCYLLSNLVQVFNQRLLNDLQGQAVKVVDGYALLNQEVSNPTQFSLTDVTTPWCNPATQSSLLCNTGTPDATAGASASNLSSWLFADSVHPTPAGYKIIANATLGQMKSFGWVQ